MAETPIHPIRKREKFRRALAAVGAWLQALDCTGFDYTLDRTERLERELVQLKEESRQSQEVSSGDADLGGTDKGPASDLAGAERRDTKLQVLHFRQQKFEQRRSVGFVVAQH
jgi:hypothetical protein